MSSILADHQCIATTSPLMLQGGGKWYCSYPELRERHDPAMLPVDQVRIELVEMNDIRLGKSIYTKNNWTHLRPSKIVKERGKLTWLKQLSWLIWDEMRKGSGLRIGSPGPAIPH